MYKKEKEGRINQNKVFARFSVFLFCFNQTRKIEFYFLNSRVDGYLSDTANEGQLILRNVRPEQSGLYKCTARGPGGQILESQVYLTVSSTRGPPSVRIQPEDQTVGQGQILQDKLFFFITQLKSIQIN